MAYRVAIATSGGHRVDLHFNASRSFEVFTLDEESGAILERKTRALPECSASGDAETAGESCGSGGGCGGGGGHSQTRFLEVADLLSDCLYLLTLKIGKQPYTVLQARGINTLEVDKEIPAALQGLHQYIKRFRVLERQTVRT